MFRHRSRRGREQKSRDVRRIHDVILPLKTWKHLALTYSAADRKVTVYVDGKEAFTQAGQGEIGDTYEDLNQLWIGGRQKEGGVEYFAGQIADVRLYNRALKADEIRSVYASTLKK